jgi:chromosome partitioning protein
MQVIVINSQKGGSAKTMLAKHLSVEAERAGDGPVFLIDTDPQGSLTAWHTKRESETPQRVNCPLRGWKGAGAATPPRGRVLPHRHRVRPC